MERVYEEIIVEVEKKAKELYGENVNVVKRVTLKNNGVKLNGVLIQKQGATVAPVIYVDEDICNVCKGNITIDDVVSKVIRQYEKHEEAPIGKSMDFNLVRQKIGEICLKVVNAEKNEELLNDIPHKRFLDLAVIYRVPVFYDQNGLGSILITNGMLEELDMTLEEIDEIAMKNLLSKKVSIRAMKDVIRDLMMQRTVGTFGDSLEEDDADEIMDGLFGNEDENPEMRMWVLGSDGMFGASCMYSQREIEILAERLEKDLYILPSSVHELIALEVSSEIEPENLKDMVGDVNSSQVPNEDILSDSVYYYDREKKELRIA